jgi:hypothetical protein
MRTLVTKPLTKVSAQQELHGGRGRSPRISPLPITTPLLQRQCTCGGGCPRCQEKLGLQTKLKISEPGDQYEQEADRIADEVMRMPEPEVQRQVEPGEEEEEERVQRQAISAGTQANTNAKPETSGAPSIIHEVLASPGQPLDAETRSFMESRFGHNFSLVRVHTDPHAAESAQAVNAVAYTVGHEVVFGNNRYMPQSLEGKRLLAHELTHVLQQENAQQTGANPNSTPALFRRVGGVNCPPNVFGAPDDPRANLESVDPIAVELANQAADSLAADAEEVRGGIPESPSTTFQSYQDHFGLPNAVGKGFLNRLTGQVRPSLEIATREELQILSRRFRLAARFFSGTVNYRCPGTAAVTLPGCGEGSCGAAFAFSCRGGGTIALCQPYWDTLDSDQAKAAALIHESMHIILGPTGLSQPGEIGEETQRGPGRNFNVAGCYEFIIDDIAGVDSSPVCPPVPAPPTFG